MEIFAASRVVPVAAPPIDGGALAVEDGRVVAVGPAADIRRRFDAPCVDYPGSIIVPGLVNAHSHLELTHFPSWLLRKGVGYSPRTYADWIVQVIKIRRALDPGEIDQSIREGLRISLQSGTTFLGEIVTARESLARYGESPLGGVLFLELIGQEPGAFRALLAETAARAGEISGTYTAGISPHSPYTLSAEAASLCASSPLRKAIHIAESPAESEFLFSSTGPLADILYPFVHWDRYLPPPRRVSPVAWLDSLGLLDDNTSAVHCVQVTPNDVAILADRGTGVILCPRSNDRLNVGVAPLQLFRKHGLRIALGTDSLASNDSLSLFEEMRFLLDLHPDLRPEEAFRFATEGGADLLGSPDRGRLAPGSAADFLVLRSDSFSGDIFENIIRTAELETVIIAGRMVG